MLHSPVCIVEERVFLHLADVTNLCPYIAIGRGQLTDTRIFACSAFVDRLELSEIKSKSYSMSVMPRTLTAAAHPRSIDVRPATRQSSIYDRFVVRRYAQSSRLLRASRT